MVGDIVKMEMSPQDLQKARIIFRMKNAEVQKNTPIHSFGPRSRGR
jgi:translation initiation factor IF-1